MPATITPNKTDQERKRRLEDNDNGSGRRPPTDKRTGGGGENDNWNDRPNGRRGPNERLRRYRMGLFFALASDLMFFVAIVSTFFVNQSTGHFDAYNHYVNEGLPTTIPPPPPPLAAPPPPPPPPPPAPRPPPPQHVPRDPRHGRVAGPGKTNHPP